MLLGLVYRFVRFLMLLAVVVVGLPAQSGAQPTCLPAGDVDQNGSVTAADALLVFQQALGLAQLSACQQTIADVFPQPANPDGSITASDALCIFQKALSLPSCLDTLSSPNQPPVVDAGPDQSVEAGVMVFLLGSGSDPDGTIAVYAWAQTGGMMVSLTGSDAATAVFVAPEVIVDETLTFRMTVSDNAGAQGSDEIRVTVHPAMEPGGANFGGRGVSPGHISADRAGEVRDLSRSGWRVGKYAAGVRGLRHTGPRGAEPSDLPGLSGCGVR